MKRIVTLAIVLFMGMYGVVRAQVVQTASWTDFYSNATTLNASPVPAGSIIDAFDPQGVHCGSITVTTPGSYGYLHVYGDDPLTTGVDEGAVPGDTITFTINGAPTSRVPAAIWQAGTPGAIIVANIASLASTVINSAAGPHGSISPSGTVNVIYGGNQTFAILPASGYLVDSLFIDGVGQAGALTYVFSHVTGDHAILATFKLSPAFATRFRTFTYDSLIVAKQVKKKNVSQYWEFSIVNNSGAAVDELNCVFANDVASITSSGSLTYSGTKKSWAFMGTLAAGDSVRIIGTGAKPKPQSIAKLFLGPVTKTPTAVKVPAAVNYSRLPMPNAASVREDAFKRYLTGIGGLIVGFARPDSAKQYGWVQMKKAGDMYKSLFDKKTGTHRHTNTGFRTFNGGKPFVKKLSSLPPSKQDNRTFADLLALRFNIVLSALGTTPRGFGELLYTEAGSPFSGRLVREIADIGDSMMTYASKYPDDGTLYAELDTAFMHINSAFQGQIDTVSWGDTLKLTGTVRVVDTGILTPSGVSAPAFIPVPGLSADGAALPDQFRLDQNYPNPFNPTTTISFEIPDAANVTLKVYTLLGQEVASLLESAPLDVGIHRMEFDGSGFSSGVYFYRLTANSVGLAPMVLTRKMLLIR